MTTDWKMHLPADFAAQLQELYEQQKPFGGNRRKPNDAFLSTIAAARNQGWTLQSLGEAVGLSRERIRQLLYIEDRWWGRPPIAVPDAPPRPLTKRDTTRLERATRPGRPSLTDDEKAELRGLQGKANASSRMRPDHPAVLAGCQLAALMDGHLKRGCSLADVAAGAGVTRAAVVLRLGRFGYRSLPPSQRRPPGPIAAAIAAAGKGGAR